MTVTTQKIKAETSQQTADHAKGIVDVSEEMVSKVFHKLKSQNLTEKHATMLAAAFFKVPDKNGKDSVLKMFNGGGNCTTINAEYLQEHYSTASRVAGNNIAKALVVVVGAAAQRLETSICGKYRAASARSEEIEFTGWAQNGHSLHQAPRAAMWGT